MNYVKRTVKLLFGLVLYSFGLVLSINANIGLAPWDTLNVGVSNVTGLTIGNASIIIGLLLLIIVVGGFKEKIGIGTILNTVLIGIFMDIIQSLNFIPQMTNLGSGVLMLLVSLVVVSFATYFYISSGFGCGPRDLIMVALGKRLVNIPIGAIRGTIEGMALILGWALGAKVGIGTLIAVFGIGFIMQAAFKLLNFEIRTVVHESIFDSITIWKNILLNEESKAMNE